MNPGTELHPLACPRCGCTESVVLQTRKYNNAREPQPLPGVRRERGCVECSRRFWTKETIEEVDLQSEVWKVTTDGKRIVETSVIPRGTHAGLWTGYEVSVEIGQESYVLHTRNDMRAEEYPCRVQVTARGIRVESVTGG